MGFSRQDYWSGLPFPSQWNLPDPGIESVLLESPALAGRFFTTVPLGKSLSPWSRAEGKQVLGNKSKLQSCKYGWDRRKSLRVLISHWTFSQEALRYSCCYWPTSFGPPLPCLDSPRIFWGKSWGLDSHEKICLYSDLSWLAKKQETPRLQRHGAALQHWAAGRGSVI